MNYPIQFGAPQIVLLLIALGGLALFIHGASELLRPRHKHLTEEEKELYWKHGRLPYRRRRFGWKRGIGGVLMIAIAVSLLWLTFLVQAYLGLTGDIKVAQIRASNVQNIPNLMTVELVLYDQNGHQTSDKTYGVMGNEWMLQGDIVKFPTWLNVLGLHTGYKLTRLEGRYDDPNLERHAEHTVVELNGGDDGFFKTVHGQSGGWLSNFVDASYGNAVFVQADGTYDVFVSQTGLFAKKTG